MAKPDRNEGSTGPKMRRIPITQQEVEIDLLAQIKGGVLQPGSPFPTTLSLVENYHSSVGVVHRAISVFRRRGVIVPDPSDRRNRIVSSSAQQREVLNDLEEEILMQPPWLHRQGVTIPDVEEPAIPEGIVPQLDHARRVRRGNTIIQGILKEITHADHQVAANIRARADAPPTTTDETTVVVPQRTKHDQTALSGQEAITYHHTPGEIPQNVSGGISYVREMWERKEPLPELRERHKERILSLLKDTHDTGFPEEDVRWVMAIAASYLAAAPVLRLSQIEHVTNAIMTDAALLQEQRIEGDVVGMAMLHSLPYYSDSVRVPDLPDFDSFMAITSNGGQVGTDPSGLSEEPIVSAKRTPEAPMYHNTLALIEAVRRGKRVEWPHVSPEVLGEFFWWFSEQIQEGLAPSMLGSDDLRLPKAFLEGHTLGGLYNYAAREAKKRDDMDPITFLNERVGIAMTAEDVHTAINLDRPIQWARVTPQVIKAFLIRLRNLEEVALPPLSLWRREDFDREFSSLDEKKLKGLIKHFYKKGLQNGVDAITEMRQDLDLHLSVDDIILSFSLDRPVPWGHIAGDVLRNFLERVRDAEGDRLPPITRWGKTHLDEHFSLLGGRTLSGLYKHFLSVSHSSTKDPIKLLREKIAGNPPTDDVITSLRTNQRIYWGRIEGKVIYEILQKAAQELAIPVSELTFSALKSKFAFLDGHSLNGLVNYSFEHRITPEETTQEAIMRLGRVAGFMTFESQSEPHTVDIKSPATSEASPPETLSKELPRTEDTQLPEVILPADQQREVIADMNEIPYINDTRVWAAEVRKRGHTPAQRTRSYLLIPSKIKAEVLDIPPTQLVNETRHVRGIKLAGAKTAHIYDITQTDIPMFWLTELRTSLDNLPIQPHAFADPDETKERTSSKMPTPTEASQYGIPDDVPLITRTTRYFEARNKPFAIKTHIIPANRAPQEYLDALAA